MSNHTPGPWRVGGPDGTKVYATDPNRPRAARCIATLGSEPRQYHSEEYTQQRNANARLIATAPDLLEALKGVVSDILEYERINNLAPNPGKQDCWQSVTRARAAIAKAEGSAVTSALRAS